MPDFKPKLQLVRAISSEFVARKLRSALLPIIIVVLVLLLVSLWLTTLNIWWWLLSTLLLVVLVATIVAYLGARLAVKTLRPNLSAEQATAVGAFVDKLERIADGVGTPMFVIVFRVVRDVVRPRDPAFITSMAQDSRSLYQDFISLSRLF